MTRGTIGFDKGDSGERPEKVMIWLKTGGVLAFEARSVGIHQRNGTLIDVEVTPMDEEEGGLKFIDPSVVAAIVTNKGDKDDGDKDARNDEHGGMDQEVDSPR